MSCFDSGATSRHAPRLLSIVALLLVSCATVRGADTPWTRHTIDASSRGADGVRLADVNRDQRPDIVTGWEEGGVVRVYLHPGSVRVKAAWPAVTVGRVRSPEDAVFADVNRDGAIDVISCCEGNTRAIFLHQAPSEPGTYLQESAWTTQRLTGRQAGQSWMFCLPLPGPPVDSLIVGSKGHGGTISRLETTWSPAGEPQVHLMPLCPAGWIMSLRSQDLDGDGDLDVLFSDRKGPLRGISWLEQPPIPKTAPWPRHQIGGTDEEMMFLDIGDLDGDGSPEIVAATRSQGILVCQQDDRSGAWNEWRIPMPPRSGAGKAVTIADVDRNGQADVVVSCGNAADLHGVFWLSPAEGGIQGDWEFHPISGDAEGVKFDRLETVDLDGDGDLDLLTCEERDNLGVIWYENPHH